MLTKTELNILKKLFDDLTRKWTIREISLELNSPYPQIHRSTKSLIKKELILKETKGKSSLIRINPKGLNKEYILTELERKSDILNKYKNLEILDKDIEKLKYHQFICILFGSYAEKKAKNTSDIDLLFIIPEEYDYEAFEKELKTKILLPKKDIQITTEQGLIEMWNKPLQLNIGNEILKKHIIFWNTEVFLKLRKNYLFGEL